MGVICLFFLFESLNNNGKEALVWRPRRPGTRVKTTDMLPFSQDDGKGGLGLRGVAVTTETATTAETATVASLCCIL